MAAVQVTATSDVPEGTLESFAARAPMVLPIALDPKRAFFRSHEAPSWIHFLQTPEFWITTIVGSAAWDGLKAGIKHRSDIVAALRGAGSQIVMDFAVSLAHLRSQISERTELFIGCPIPNDWFATVMLLRGADPEVLAGEISTFLTHMPAIDRFYSDNAGNVTGQVTLEIADDGALLIRWMDIETLTPQTSRLEPTKIL